jgi:RHS repeat-associated protein
MASTSFKDQLGRVVQVTVHSTAPELTDVVTHNYYGLINIAVPSSTVPQPDNTGETFSSVFVARQKDTPTGPITHQVSHTVEVDPENHATHRLTDEMGRLTDVWLPSATDALSATTVYPHWHYEYDAPGKLIKQTDPKNNITQFEYDQSGNRTRRTLPDGKYEEWQYDARGRVSLYWDFNRKTTYYLYNDSDIGQGRLERVYRYDGTALPKTSTGDPESSGSSAAVQDYREKTVYFYDDALRTGHVARVEEWTRDTTGTVTEVWSTAYTYDPVTGGVTSEKSYEGDTYDGVLVGDIHRDYDPATGRLVRTYTPATASTSFNETAYAYDTRGRLEKVYAVRVNGAASTITMQEDAARTPILDANGNPQFTGGVPAYTKYEYDLPVTGRTDRSLDRVSMVSSGTTGTVLSTTDTQYDGFGRQDLVTVKSGTVTEFTQDFDYYPDGQKLSVLETRNYGTPTRAKTTWTYDYQNRLWTETLDGDPTPGNGVDNFGTQEGSDYTDTYAFDRAGNRIRKTHDEVGTNKDAATAYAYDTRDRLTAEGPDTEAPNTSGYNIPDPATATTYGYDDNGSQTTVTVNSAVVKRNFWDLRNRLVGFSANDDLDTTDVNDATYYYNTDGVRVKSAPVTSTGVQTTYFVQDTANPTGYSQVMEEWRSVGTTRPTTDLVRSYRIGRDVIAQADGSTVRHMLYDGGGSTRGLLDNTGQPITTEVYTYDAFGTRIDTTANPLTPLLYRGEYFDKALGQYQLRARYYNPSSGRFTSADSYLGDPEAPRTLNLYAYASASPITHLDPSGHVTLAEINTTIGDIAKAFETTLNMISKVRTVINYVDMMIDLADALNSGGLVAMMRSQVAAQVAGWGNIASHVQTARLLDLDFYEEAGIALGRQAPKLLPYVFSNFGLRVQQKYAKQKRKPFHWALYMPTPVELAIPNISGWLPIPKFEILHAPVGLRFGGGSADGKDGDHRGRLLGLGIRDDGTGQYMQLFRMDYHDPNTGNHTGYYDVETVQKYKFNFHSEP